MSIIYGQYNAKKYPLKQYSFHDIPSHIRDVLKKLCDKDLAICRGGIAYILLTNDYSYLLKDMDMLAKEDSVDEILCVLSKADNVYINKNTFGCSVITAFWEDNYEYYKLDILLQREKVNDIDINNDIVDKVVSASYIWRDRIRKISENVIRGHSTEKTLRHFYVAYNISIFLLKHIELIDESDRKIVASILDKTYASLQMIIDYETLQKFINLQNILLRS